MFSIALANKKGGTGKSTSAANLAAALALRGKKVILIDGDSQGTSSRILAKPADIKTSLASVLLPRQGEQPATLDEVVMHTQIEGLDLIPASLQLDNFDREGLTSLYRMKDFLQTMRRSYDFAIIDTPGYLGMLTSAIMAATNYVIVVVQADPEPLTQFPELLKLMAVAKESNKKLSVLGALVTMFDPRQSVSAQVHDALRSQFPGRTFDTIIHMQVRLKECPSVHKPIQLHVPTSRGAQQYGELADEVLSILKNGKKAAR